MGGDSKEDTSNRSYRKPPLFILVDDSLDVPPEHTHTDIQSAALILPKIRVKKRSLLTILSCIARTQSQACIA
jgi:hypothetical protein